MCSSVAAALADGTSRSKMSPLVRHAARMATATEGQHLSKAAATAGGSTATLTAFVKVSAADGATLIEEQGCRVLATFGDIYIVSIPTDRIDALAGLEAVSRIEAGERCNVTMDTTGIIVDATSVYDGREPLPQPYTGSGVVVGLQDIGFDLTHPTFYDTSLNNYRIRRFWDQLSADTVGSTMYVGAEYTDEDELLTYGRSRDYALESHGTHTLGTAAGSGYDTAYRGIAYDSDICLVSNAVTSDTVYIAADDLYKYTSATDALGFKYIFDYADETGQPCVISFSEGSRETFDDEECLYHAVLDSLVGPGRIIVASAGNDGMAEGYIHKTAGQESAGTFIRSYVPYLYTKILSAEAFDLTFSVYGSTTTSVTMTSAAMLAADSLYTDSLTSGDFDYRLEVSAAPASYDTTIVAYRLYVEKTARDTASTASTDMGADSPVSIEVTGSEADILLLRGTGYFRENSLNPSFTSGDYGYCVNSPGSAPAVICAGASGWRTAVTNFMGLTIGADFGSEGQIATFSSTGPTVDGRTKPDVVAPGTNIVSACSSFFIEANAEDSTQMSYMTAFFDFDGRTYGWYNNNGTSMSTPVVAGVIALWLEADPTLSPDDVMDVIERTSNTYDTTLSYPNNTYGYGEIDAYQGLLYILGLSGIDHIKTQPTGVGAGGRRQTTRVYTLDGRLWTGSATAAKAPPGIYIVRQTTDRGVVTRKIAVTE